MPFTRFASKSLLVLLLATASSGCFAIGPTGPSKVSRAERYVPGAPEYDSFFAELHELQLEMGRAPGESKEVRAELAEHIDLEKTASIDLISERLKKRAEQLADRGIGLKVEFLGLEGDEEGDASVSASGEPKGQDARFVRHVERGAKRAAQMILKMRQVKKRARELAGKIPDLEVRVDQVMHPRGPARTAEAKRNLYDARVLLTLIVERSETLNDSQRQLISAIQTATKTPASDAYKTDDDVAAAAAQKDKGADKAKDKNRAQPAGSEPKAKAAKAVRPIAVERPTPPAAPKKTTFADFNP